jgi:asparagine synthase (glutamine-hydrolysing)
MCGFTGFIDFNNHHMNYESILDKCATDIHFRGPDDNQKYIDHKEGIFLSFRRLSFMDLSMNSSQPLISQSNNSLILFNGEIYNYQFLLDNIKDITQLKPEDLISDTQVILEYISLKGINSFLDNYSGMMSLVYFDLLNKKIYLCSDHFGQKPLYYSFQNNSLYFSSDIRTIRNNPKFKRIISAGSVDNYLFKNQIEIPSSIYKNVFKISPSSLISLDYCNNQINNLNESKYYDQTNFNNPNISNLSLHETIIASVDECLNSDVSIGAFLSSGIDSSLITSIANKALDYKIDTFSLGFNETGFDESQDALKISKHLNIKNEIFKFTDNEIIDNVDILADAFSEPFADSSQLPYIFLCSKTSKFVKGVLTGDGGDELFGGYNRHFTGVRYFRLVKKYPFLRQILNSKYFKILFQSNNSLLNTLLKIILKIQYPGDKIFRMINALNQNNIYDFYQTLTSHNEYKNYNTNNNITNSLNKDEKNLERKMMSFDLNYFLPNDLMVKSDRASMFNSLEARSPFLNKNIYEKSISIPNKDLFKNGIKKNPLKEILSIYVPDKLISKHKKGFIVPIDKWLRSILKDQVKYYLSDIKIKNSPINNNYIRYILDSFYKKNKGVQYELWDILMFQMWYEKYH